MGHWIKQNIAHNQALGIAAGIDVQLPSAFIWRVYRQVLGDQIPKEQLLAKAALTWRLYRLLPDLIKQTGFEDLARFLADVHGARQVLPEAQRWQSMLWLRLSKYHSWNSWLVNKLKYHVVIRRL